MWFSECVVHVTPLLKILATGLVSGNRFYVVRDDDQVLTHRFHAACIARLIARPSANWQWSSLAQKLTPACRQSALHAITLPLLRDCGFQPL